jgi:large subunit ribosomal protein L24
MVAINKNIKKGDMVYVIAGKCKGKQGPVIAINREKNRIFISGINYIKKHEKPNKKNEKGGIVEKEASVAMSNVLLFCKKCNTGVRVACIIKKDVKIRQCKKCEQEIGK